MASDNHAMPLIEDGYQTIPRVQGQLIGDTQQPDVQPASHHALSTAYNDLKKRYNDLEQRNKQLARRVLDLQRGDSLRASPLSSSDITPTASRESSPQISGSRSSFAANGSVSSTEELVVHATLQELEEKLLKLQSHEQKLMDEKLELTDRCRNVEKANAQLTGEIQEMKQTNQAILTQIKSRDGDLMDKNLRLEKENEQYMRKDLSNEKRLRFLEKQLLEQKAKNSHLEEEYMMSKSEFQEDASTGHIGDWNESVIEELRNAVRQYHMELRDLQNLACDQRRLIDQLVQHETERNSLLGCHRRRSRDSSALSSIATSHGARPKTSTQRSPSVKSKSPATQPVEANVDTREQTAYAQKDSLNPYDGVMHDKYHRRSASQGSQDTRSFHSGMGKNENEPEKSYDMGNPSYSYKIDAMTNWLGQLHMARNDSLEHLNDLQDDDDIFGNLDVLENLEDNVAMVDRESDRAQSQQGLPQQSGVTPSARPSHYSSTVPRQSHRLSVQDTQAVNQGASMNVQSPQRRSTSTDRSRDSDRRRSSGVRSPNAELENRYRPNSASQQPRPLNIDRNEDVANARRSYDNTTQNINLNIQTEKDRAERPDNLVLNNDPLVGHKVIPNRNIYREDTSVKEGQIVAATPGEIVHICPVCTIDFSTASMEEFQRHVLDCCDSMEPSNATPGGGAATITVEARVCPICNDEFPFMIDQKDFEDHVNGHFEDEERRFEILEP